MGHLIGATPQIMVRRLKGSTLPHGISFQDPFEAKFGDEMITTKSMGGDWTWKMTMGTELSLQALKKIGDIPRCGACDARAPSFLLSKDS